MFTINVDKERVNNTTVKMIGNLKNKLKYGLARRTWEPDKYSPSTSSGTGTLPVAEPVEAI